MFQEFNLSFQSRGEIPVQSWFIFSFCLFAMDYTGRWRFIKRSMTRVLIISRSWVFDAYLYQNPPLLLMRI